MQTFANRWFQTTPLSQILSSTFETLRKKQMVVFRRFYRLIPNAQ